METATPAAPLRVRISAPNAPNERGRWRGKPARLWGKNPVSVEVCDNPSGDGQISHESFARIQSDPLIKVEFSGGSFADTAAANEVSSLKAALVAANDKIAKLTADIAAAAEVRESERAAWVRDSEELARKAARADGDAATARARLSDAQAAQKRK